MLIQGEVSQLNWMGKALDIKKEEGNTLMDQYLLRFLADHPRSMTIDDLSREELNVAIQAIGGR